MLCTTNICLYKKDDIKVKERPRLDKKERIRGTVYKERLWGDQNRCTKAQYFIKLIGINSKIKEKVYASSANQCSSVFSCSSETK